jgi:phosphopantothenoylcysteine decarboxylase/phosphopantothenate--cysteine ligase
MKNLNVLITAGPTREYLDPVRYISNDSSGKMGFSLAAAAGRLGAQVTLVSGPVALSTPKGVRRVDVVSADEMRREVMKRQRRADVIVMAAAVSDFKAAHFSKQKIKKATCPPVLKLSKTIDILAELGRKKRADQLLVGFAVETKNLETYAQKKLKEKRCDWIVANRHTVIGKDKGHAALFSKKGRHIVLPELPKDELAFIILSHILD